MKSVLIVIAAIASFTAASADSVLFKRLEPNLGFGSMKHRGLADRRSPLDQSSCETNWTCGTGEQVIYNKDTNSCECKITNGGAACAAAGGDGNTWYTDSKGDVCCGFKCEAGTKGCEDETKANDEKKDCS